MKFCDVPVGNERALAKLRRMVDDGRIPHAILLEGPSGVGKMLAARAFVQYLHCRNPHDGEPCGTCNSCRMHQGLNHIDLCSVYPVIRREGDREAPTSDDYADEWRRMLADHPSMSVNAWTASVATAAKKKNAQPVIYVAESDRLVKWLSTSASRRDSMKAVLMWLPERLNEEAANKLLKVIEEPFGRTVFILVSNDASLLLPTIVSRCQRVEMYPLPDAGIEQWLTTHCGADAARARALAPLAEGSLTTAEQLLENADDALPRFMQLMRLAYQRQVGRLREWSNDLAGEGREQQARFWDYCARMVRENFVANLSGSHAALSTMTDAESSFSSKFARFITERNVEGIVRAIERARRDIAANGNAKMVNFDTALQMTLLIKNA